MNDQDQNPGRKWDQVENEEGGDRHFDNFRFTPYTTDMEFFRDPNIYETEVRRKTQEAKGPETDTARGPRGDRRTDEQIGAEIQDLLDHDGQIDSRDIHVDIQAGTVTLTGNVKSPYEWRAIEGMSRNVLGVLDVHNRLQIRPVNGSPDRWVDPVEGSGVYPASEAGQAPGDSHAQGMASWGQGERGARGYEDHGGSEIHPELDTKSED